MYRWLSDNISAVHVHIRRDYSGDIKSSIQFMLPLTGQCRNHRAGEYSAWSFLSSLSVHCAFHTRRLYFIPRFGWMVNGIFSGQDTLFFFWDAKLTEAVLPTFFELVLVLPMDIFLQGCSIPSFPFPSLSYSHSYHISYK